jgi:hypothetical protein
MQAVREEVQRGGPPREGARLARPVFDVSPLPFYNCYGLPQELATIAGYFLLENEEERNRLINTNSKHNLQDAASRRGSSMLVAGRRLRRARCGARHRPLAPLFAVSSTGGRHRL